MKVKDITDYIESFAPLSFQESYDNSGLITGNPLQEVSGALLTIDTTEEVIDEAIKKNINLVISHHPIIFSGLKSITGKNYIEKTIIKAIQNNISIYAAHTNMDNISEGVNAKICEKIGLVNYQHLSNSNNKVCKLVTFVPTKDANKVKTALFEAGAGHIGNYDQCSFNTEGEGTFRAGEDTNAYVGKKGELHTEKEIRIETVFPKHLESLIVKALIKAHPYEEVAYDIFLLENKYHKTGAGMIGELKVEMTELAFLKHIKKIFKSKVIRHTSLLNKKIKKVAVCGGSGSTLLDRAIKKRADIFISADFKYHQFFDAENKIIIADIGHFESEQYTMELFYDILIKKFPKFALRFSETKTNPLNYF